MATYCTLGQRIFCQEVTSGGVILHDAFDYIALLLIPLVVGMVPIALFVLAHSRDRHTNHEIRIARLERWRAAETGITD